MENLNKNGITLIALIITIIVLLFLAAVTLNFVMGYNGIIKKAILAREKTNQASMDEEQELANLENKMEDYITSRAPNETIGYKTDGTEINTGKTYDGKILYQKTLKLTNDDFSTGSGNLAGLSIYKLDDNIENAFIIHDYSSFKLNDLMYQTPITFCGTVNNAIITQIVNDNGIKYISIQNYLGYTPSEYTFTIQYTKN